MTSQTSLKTSYQPTIRDILQLLFRQRNKMVLFFVTVVLTVTFATIVAPNVYESKSKILVRLGRESVSLDPTVDAASRSTISVGQSREAEIMSEVEIIKSNELARAMVEHFGPEKILYPNPQKADSFSPWKMVKNWVDSLIKLMFGKSAVEDAVEDPIIQEAAQAFSQNLTTEVNSSSNIIDVSYKAYKPELAKEMLEQLLDAYLNRHIAVHQASGSLEFFQQQTASLKEAKRKSEDRLKELRLKTGIGSLAEAQNQASTRLGQIKAEINKAEEAVAVAAATADALNQKLKTIPSRLLMQKRTGISNPTLTKMKSDLFELRVREQRLAARYEEGAEPLTSIREEIRQAEDLLKKEDPSLSEETSNINNTYQVLKEQMITAEAARETNAAKLATLNRQYEQEEAAYKDILRQAVEINRLEEDIRLQDLNFQKYSEKTEQARINQALERERISNISFVQLPTMPIKHIRPRRKLNMIAGFLLGVLGAIGLAYLADMLDKTVKDPYQIESQLKLPLLAAAPDLRPEK